MYIESIYSIKNIFKAFLTIANGIKSKGFPRACGKRFFKIINVMNKMKVLKENIFDS
jgi:hypothetical protein